MLLSRHPSTERYLFIETEFCVLTPLCQIGDIYIPRDRHTRESRGFAFVRYYNKDDAEGAKFYSGNDNP